MDLFGGRILRTLAAGGRAALIPALCLVSAVPPARAEEMGFAAVGKPMTYSLPGVALDINSISPGMTETDARVALFKVYPDADQSQINATISNIRNGVIFRSKPVTAQVSVQQVGNGFTEVMTLNFGLPTTQSPVIGILRRIDYANGPEAPSLDQTLAALAKKYGEPSFRQPDARAGSSTLVWVFGEGRLQRCGGASPCPYIPSSFALSRLDAYRIAVGQKSDVMMQVDIRTHPQDPGRIKQFKIMLADNRGAVQTYEAGQEQIAAYFAQKGPATPRMAGPAPGRP